MDVTLPARNRALTTATLIALLIMGILCSVARAAQSPELMTRITDDKMATILNGMGIEFQKLQDSTFIVKFNGFQAVLINDLESMQLFAGFTQKASLNKINEWNRTKRYTRAYIDSEGDPGIEADLGFLRRCDRRVRGGIYQDLSNVGQGVRRISSSLKQHYYYHPSGCSFPAQSILV